MEVQGLYLKSPILCVNIQANLLFQNNVSMAQNQSMHLEIDDRIQLIPISIKPVQFF